MKTFLLILLFAASLAAESPREGTFWQTLTPVVRSIWATGWIDGVCAGEMVVASDQYSAKIAKWNGLNSAELAEGITQFYEADYRNLKIWMQDAALLVARYSREGMTSREAVAQIELLRARAIKVSP